MKYIYGGKEETFCVGETHEKLFAIKHNFFFSLHADERALFLQFIFFPQLRESRRAVFSRSA